MANIKVNDIKPAGADLFGDSESFMNELVESEVDYVQGGMGIAVSPMRLLETDTYVASCTCDTKDLDIVVVVQE